jgi:hypothetical protein
MAQIIPLYSPFCKWEIGRITQNRLSEFGENNNEDRFLYPWLQGKSIRNPGDGASVPGKGP